MIWRLCNTFLMLRYLEISRIFEVLRPETPSVSQSPLGEACENFRITISILGLYNNGRFRGKVTSGLMGNFQGSSRTWLTRVNSR